MTCKGCKQTNGVTAGPRPYYEEVNQETVQSHDTVYSNTVFAAGIPIAQSWNIPAKGTDIAVFIGDVTNVPVGAYLYNEAYGYLKVSHWNPRERKIGLLNEGIAGNAPLGSFVQENTVFFLAPKPCCEDDTATLFPFLSEDFTAPIAGLNLTIEVTSTFGLRLGELVRIGNGVYRLNLINSSRQIVIRNEGAGFTPGTVVEARNADGEHQYLITSENVTACSASEAYEARLIACDGTLERILRGSHAGQVPVLQVAATGLVKYQHMDSEPRTCSEMTTPMVIQSGVLNYTIQVASTAGFAVNDIIQVSFGSLRFKVNGIPNATSLSVSGEPAAPTSSFTIVAGGLVCKVLTTENILRLLSGVGEGAFGQIAALQTQINQINTNLGTSNATIAAETAARIAADAAITTGYQNGDTTLQNNINGEAAVRNQAVTVESSARVVADNAITAAYQAADSNIQNDRINGDSNLQNQINSLNTRTSDTNLGSVQSAGGSGTHPATNLNVASTFISGGRVDVVITNPSNRDMRGVFVTSTQCPFGINTSGTCRTHVLCQVMTQCYSAPIGQTQFTGWGGVSALVRQQNFTPEYTINGSFQWTGMIAANRSFQIPPGHEIRFRGEGQVHLVSLGGANQVEVAANAIDMYMDAIMVKM